MSTTASHSGEKTEATGGGRIGANLGLTVNLGNFESIRFDVYQEATFTGGPGDTREDVFAAILDDCRERLYESLAGEIRNFRELKKSLVS